MKQKTLTQSLSWLHTWSGLIFGWLLFAIFLTGSLAVFDKEIDGWMRPEIPVHDVDQLRAAQVAIDYLRANKGDAPAWNIGLPTERSAALSVSAGERARGGGQVLDPISGEPIAVRQTAGGGFFFGFHFTLHMPRNIGIWVVGLAAMAMLVALLSGIVIHKKFFKEFFTFRPAKGQRSWLDAHNATAVLVLPFHLMITYTGLVIFYLIYMPAAVDALFDGNREAFGRGGRPAQQAEVAPDGARPAERGAQHAGAGHDEPVRPPAAQPERAGRGSRDARMGEEWQAQGRGLSGSAQQAAPAGDERRGHQAARMTELGPLLAVAERTLGPIASLSIQNPGQAGMRIEARPVLGNRIELTKGESMLFDGVTGAVLRAPSASRPAQLTQRVMSGLHFAQFGGYPMRWLYFICGLASCAMLATGVVLFTVKRQRRHDHEGVIGVVLYHAAERINIAVVAGLSLACVAYLWGGRLLPVELAQRSAWEVNLFFLVWAATLAHAIVRPRMRAWREQLGLAALLCIGLPFLDLVDSSRGNHVWLQATSVLLGVLLAWACWRVGQPAKTRAARRAGKLAEGA
ncbi:PepSY-associated TM helix domain-containing protein [Pseudomonas sp. LRF_L74]|uniref:PepSY-associated TM helix domain-containing protein n=1 Tax=Pseudomonas sp. LRF_L74 TaxID=3369422 RepID=UPI003F609706